MVVKDNPNIFIVGSFGVGKSTIGRKLAQKMARQFFDMDRIIEERLGVDLSWIFDIEGEEGFQQREFQLLEELCCQKNAVISTSGSLALLQRNIDLLLQQENAKILYLHTSLDQQIKRVIHNRYKRPLLRVENIQECLQKLCRKCNPCYEAIAHFKFSTHNEPTAVILKNILNSFQKEPNHCHEKINY